MENRDHNERVPATTPTIDDVHPVIPGDATISELWRVMWPYTAGQRRVIGLLLPTLLALFGLTAYVPLLIGEGIQLAVEAETGSDRRDLLMRVGVLVGAVAVIAILRLTAARIAVGALSSAGKKLQRSIFDQIHRTALIDSGAIARPSMIQRCSSYVTSVEAAIRSAAMNGVPALINLVLALALLIWIAPLVGVVMLFVVVVLEAIRRLRSPVWSRRSHDRLESSTELSEHIDMVISHTEALRLSRGTALTGRRFDHLADQLTNAQNRVDLTANRVSVTAMAVGQFGTIAVIAVVAVAGGAIDVAQATAAVLFMNRVTDSLSQLPSVIAELHDASPYARRLRRILLAPPLRPDPVDAADHIERTHFADVTMTGVYAGITGHSSTLTRFSLHAEPGSWTTLTSPVPAGSSVVIALLAGVIDTEIGEITIAGSDTRTWSAQRCESMVAVVPNDPAEFPGTLRENLLSDADDDTLLNTLRQCGLDLTKFRMPQGLNTEIGLRKRPLNRESRVAIALARAVLAGAPVVVIDDPTRLFDSDAAIEVWERMRRIFADRTVIAATNRLEVITDHDHIIVMRNGGAIERGRRSQLVAAGGTFASWWGRSRAGGAIRLDALPGLEGLDEDALEALSARLITERYEAGDVIVSAGDPAERLYLVADGEVELLDASGTRLALCRPGDHFGDLDPDASTTATTTARALEATVVSSLHRFAISSGVAGVLDRPPAQRSLFGWLARRGSATRAEIGGDEGPGPEAAATLDDLVAARMVVVERDHADGLERFRVAGSRRRRRSSSLLGSLFDDG